MCPFADTSFLFATYFQQANSQRAAEWLESAVSPAFEISPLVRYEFVQGARMEAHFRRTHGVRGFTEEAVLTALGAFELDEENGAITMTDFDWAAILSRAYTLSERHTIAEGHRALDILHVATALNLGAREFLTFDQNQRRLAEAEGLIVPV